MDFRKYFEKNGFVYGIEQPNQLCGYSTKCIRFDNIEMAVEWLTGGTKSFRFLGTKTDAKHCNLKNKWEGGDNMKRTSEAQKRASAKYDKANTKGIYLKLNKETDADIISYLEEADNVQGLIKELIRRDMVQKVLKQTVEGRANS